MYVTNIYLHQLAWYGSDDIVVDNDDNDDDIEDINMYDNDIIKNSFL